MWHQKPRSTLSGMSWPQGWKLRLSAHMDIIYRDALIINLFLYMVRIHASSILYTRMCAYLVKLSQRCRMVYWIQTYHTYHFSNAFIVSAISAGSKSHFSDGWLYVDTDQDHFTAFPKNYISAPNLEYAGSCTLHHEHGGIINCPFPTRWHLR